MKNWVTAFLMVFSAAFSAQALEIEKRNKFGAEMWNALETRDNLKKYLGVGLRKNETTRLDKMIKKFPAKLPKAKFEKGEVAFQGVKTRWSIVKNGVSFDGKLYAQPRGLSFEKKI